MKVLVDTCVWSHALRHKNPDLELIQKLSDLIEDGRAVLIGPIKQELLSGIAHQKQFDKLKDILSAFELIPLQNFHFEQAATFCNQCRTNGIQGSSFDFLICAVAHCENISILTVDNDFKHYSTQIAIDLI